MLGYEVLGAERRRRWSLSEKRRIISEAFSAAEGVSSVARRHSIYPQQIYRWRRDLGDCGIAPKVRFLPVSVATAADTEAALATVASVRVEIGCLGGRALRIDGAIDCTQLQNLIRLVETA